MIGNDLVVDAVVHPYNLGAANRDPGSQTQLDSVYAAHALATAPRHADYKLTPEEFFTDFSFEAMAQALFLESPVDFAVIHALPNHGYAKSYVTDPVRAAAFRNPHPTRFLTYGTVDTPIIETALEQLEWQVRELHIDGLKVYPSFFYDGVGEGWRLDGPDFATPLLEAARDLGIRNVAIHKALWLPPAPKDVFRVDDLAAPLERFPELNFQIVHAGMAFVEETIALLQEHPNLYATLESTFAYVNVRPQQFADVLSRMLDAVGSTRLLFASGTNLMHPRPVLDGFRRMTVSHLGPDDRANILGLNALRLHGLIPEDVHERTADDEYAQLSGRAEIEPWSVVR
jgi:predicted TIM-barrel fold metal-dependent hydrolase